MNPLARTPANNVWKMNAIRTLYWTHFFSSVLIPFYQDWGGISFAAILMINAWFMLLSFLLEIPTGTVADFWGRRASVALCFVVASIGVLIYVSRPDLKVFLLAEVFLATAMTLLSGADEALVYDSLKEVHEGSELDARAKTAIARLESFKLGGILVGALLGSVIANFYGLTMPMKAWLGPLGLGFLLALTLYEPPRRKTEAQPAYRQVLLSGVRYFVDHAVLRVLALDMVIVASLSFMIVWVYQPFLDLAGVDLPYFGTVHALMGVGQILVLANISRLESLFGSQQRFLRAAPILAGVSFIVLGSTRIVWVVVAAILLAASFGLSRAALFGAHFNRHIPSEKRATVLSTISMFRTVAIAVINPIVGWAADASLSWTAIGIGTAMIVLTLVFGVEERHLESVPEQR